MNKPIAFILASTNHGTMITNRNDFHASNNGYYGVGYQLLATSSFDENEVSIAKLLISKRRKYFQDGVIAIDCGANIGVHTIEWGKLMFGWGEVLAFEAQEKVFYALAGNIAINNCFNVSAENVAVGSHIGTIDVPVPNYNIPASYGSLEIVKSSSNEYIGQDINYTASKTTRMISLDSLNLDRLDFIKIDVEGMEEDVLNGAEEIITKCKPIMIIEHIKSDKNFLNSFCESKGYKVFPIGINFMAIHNTDPILKDIHLDNNKLTIR